MRLYAALRHLRVLNETTPQNRGIDFDLPESGERFRLFVGSRVFRRVEHWLVLQQRQNLGDGNGQLAHSDRSVWQRGVDQAHLGGKEKNPRAAAASGISRRERKIATFAKEVKTNY